MEKLKKPTKTFIHTGDGKKEFVEKMFDDISPQYDFLNRFLSFGIDIYWRKKFIKKLSVQNGHTILDVACGTGDIGLEILKKNTIQLINIDISRKMLDFAKIKAKKRNHKNIEFIKGDAEYIPLNDNSVDLLTISYGFRNIANYEKALSEFYRVLKPGGTLGILEFSIPKSKFFGILFNFYFHQILPFIGSIFSRTDAYKYLPESVDFFPSRKIIIKKIEQTGFSNSKYIDLTFGISTIFIGKKIG